MEFEVEPRGRAALADVGDRLVRPDPGLDVRAATAVLAGDAEGGLIVEFERAFGPLLPASLGTEESFELEGSRVGEFPGKVGEGVVLFGPEVDHPGVLGPWLDGEPDSPAGELGDGPAESVEVGNGVSEGVGRPGEGEANGCYGCSRDRRCRSRT